MEEKKKYDWKAIAIVIMAIVLVTCFVNINSLSTQNQNLNNSLNNQANEINSLKQQINNIYANVDEQMKKEASMLSGVDYSIGSLDADKTAVSLNFSVVPKVLAEDMKVKVSVDGKTAELEKDGNAFVGTIDVGMFILNDQYPLLTIETGNETKTEYLEEVRIDYLFNRILPVMKANISGRSTYNHTGGKLTTDMDFSLSCKPNGSDVVFTSFTLVEEIDGKEINREDITDAVKKAEYNYRADYKKTFNIKQGSEVSVYVLAEDSLGFIHKTRAWGRYQSKDGAEAEAVMTGEYIYDKNGKLLYPVDSSLYK